VPGQRLWWKHGVVYQIYPRSFMDWNGDGVGDLEGIRRRLDHLSFLGVDAIWLSPCFPSPMADFGYDVADYCDIDPLFGTLDDFDRLLRAAHARDIRVILDWVPNHTSDRHPWFLDSRSSRTSSKRGWYVWRDPAPGGGPPNNWQAIFGGPAWEWDEATGQYYLHSFLVQQPDLDWRNPEVVAAMHDVLRFWLERGVDGFRIDVIHKIAKDPELRDNPVRENPLPGYLGQIHVNDENHPDVHVLLRGIRRVLEGYPERMAVGEVALSHPSTEEMVKYYGQGDELHLAFDFPFLFAPWSAGAYREEIERFLALLPPGCWPDWVLSNHDFPRHATRHDHPELGEARARIAAAMLLTLRGTPFLYYGEEIGMRNAEIPEERMQDPLAWTIHPKLSRDPERTPMQWDASPGAGFTRGEPWLPIHPDSATRNVEAQRWDSASLLHLYRDLIALRRATPALERGSLVMRDAPEGVLAWDRHEGPSHAVVALNLGDAPARVELGGGRVAGGLHTTFGAALPARAEIMELGPCEGVVLVVGEGEGESDA
jgi:alpha-glucosidase